MIKPNPKIRFLRFDIASYYPSGGCDSECGDLSGKFATEEEAKSSPKTEDSAQVYDTWTGKNWYLDPDNKWREFFE